MESVSLEEPNTVGTRTPGNHHLSPAPPPALTLEVPHGQHSTMSLDTVSEVASRLKQVSVSIATLEKTRSEHRGLECRYPYGTLQKGDNGRKRICALLEYVAREEEGVSIPMTTLASIAFMKEQDFQKFHERVGIFRTTKHPKAPTVSNKNSIPSLAMKLGSYMTDSSGVAVRAQRLLGDLCRFYRKNTFQIRDMVQHARTYEAACFYIVATQDYCEYDVEEKQIQASNVVNVSSDFSLGEFAEVEGHVRQLVREMNENNDKGKSDLRENMTDRKKRKTSQVYVSSSSMSKQPKNAAVRTAKRSKQAPILGQLEERATTLDCRNEDSFHTSVTTATIHDTSYSPKFVAWRDMLLQRAIKSATKEIKSSDQNVVVFDILHDQALEFAARSLLQLRGY